MSALHYIVKLEDRRNADLSGRPGCRYESPPHELEDARRLVGMMLDRPAEQIIGEGPWRRPIAGGERTATLIVADQLFDPDQG